MESAVNAIGDTKGAPFTPAPVAGLIDAPFNDIASVIATHAYAAMIRPERAGMVKGAYQLACAACIACAAVPLNRRPTPAPLALGRVINLDFVSRHSRQLSLDTLLFILHFVNKRFF